MENWLKALESPKGLLHCHKISITLIHRWLKTGQVLLPNFTILFHPGASHTL